MPPLEFLKDAEFYALFDTPYNPAPEYTPEFKEEHERPHRQMKDALFEMGGGQSWRPFSYEAFDAMEDCWSRSRYVAASIRSPRFVRSDLFRRLHEIVLSFEHAYAMHIISDLNEVPSFEVLITKNRFVVRMPDQSQLWRIFDSHSG